MEYVRDEFGGSSNKRVGYVMLQEKALMVRDELRREYEVVHGLIGGGLGNDGAVGDHREELDEHQVVVAADHTDNAAGMTPMGNESVSTIAASTANDAPGPNEVAYNDEGINETQKHSSPSAPPTDNVVINNDAVSGVTTDVRTHDNNATDENQQQLPPSQSNTSKAATITQDEYQSLRTFKASISWLRELAKKFNFPMDNLDDSRVNWVPEGTTHPTQETEEEMERRRMYYESYYQEHEHETGDVDEEHMQTELQQEMHHHEQELPSQEEQGVIYHEAEELPVHPEVDHHQHPQHASQDTAAMIADAQVEEILNGQDGLGEMAEDAGCVPTHETDDAAVSSWV